MIAARLLAELLTQSSDTPMYSTGFSNVNGFVLRSVAARSDALAPPHQQLRHRRLGTIILR